jgi:undecaprenyl-diphosphatase
LRTLQMNRGAEANFLNGICQFLILLDRSVFKAINSIAGKSPVLDWLARLGADDHIIPVVLTLLVLLLVIIARDRRAREKAFTCLICAFIAVAVSMILLYALNAAFFRPRPFTSYTSVHLLFYHNTDSAFPSNAATLAYALAFSVLLYNRKVGLVMVALATYLGFARVMVGIHYPLDIVSGALMGLGGAFLAGAAEPLYRPLARAVNSASGRLLASWKSAEATEPKGSCCSID